MPKVDALVGHAPARPARRARHVPPLETRLHPGEARLEGRAGLERPRLVARPGAELAVAAAPREIGVGAAFGDRRDRPLDAAPAAPRSAGRRGGLRGGRKGRSRWWPSVSKQKSKTTETLRSR